MNALLKASAIAIILMTTAACTDDATATAPQATGLAAKATAALEGRQHAINRALEEAGA
jgi:hypothetical protein